MPALVSWWRHPENAVGAPVRLATFTFDIQGIVPVADQKLVGSYATATISTLDAASPFTTNTGTDPHAVAIAATSQPVAGNSLTHIFPAHSVTVLTLRVTTNH